MLRGLLDQSGWQRPCCWWCDETGKEKSLEDDAWTKRWQNVVGREVNNTNRLLCEESRGEMRWDESLIEICLMNWTLIIMWHRSNQICCPSIHCIRSARIVYLYSALWLKREGAWKGRTKSDADIEVHLDNGKNATKRSSRFVAIVPTPGWLWPSI